MRGLPFQIGVVVDGDTELDGIKVACFLDGVLKSLRQFLPHTPVELVMLLANMNERQFAENVTRRNVRIRQIDGDPNGQGLAWLCSHCSLVVAVSATAVGGRARQALDFRIHSIPPDLGGNRGVFFAPETGPVVLLEALSLPPADVVGLEGVTFPQGQSFRQMQQQMHELDRANAAAQRLGPYRDARSMADLPADTAQADLVHLFQLIDTLSRQQQRQVTLSHGGMLALGFVAVVLMQLMGMLVAGFPMADVYAMVFMLLGLGHMAVRKRESADQYADYRVLAECLRVQYFWRKAGVSDAPADYFLHKHVQRLGWVREVVKSFHVQAPLHATELQSVLEPWVRGQQRYHEGSAKRNGRLFHGLGLGVWASYGCSAILTVLVYWVALTPAFDAWLGAALGLTASCGTLLLIFNSSMGFGSREAQHQRMAESFALAGQLFNQVTHAHERRELLVDLGRETIQETSEWIYVQGPP